MGNNSEDSFDFSSLLKQKNPNHEPNNEPIQLNCQIIQHNSAKINEKS